MARQSAIKGVKGMPDILPDQTSRWQRLEAVTRDLLAAAGFAEIRTPVVEHLEVFTTSVGESSDIVRKEMYAFADKKGRQLALRPECTASVVRAFTQHSLAGQGEELRLWYTGPMFRNERPQKGRQRQFHQVGVEVFGNPSPLLDAEIIALNVRWLEALGVAVDRVLVNSLGGADSRPRYREALVAYAEQHYDDLCDECHQRLRLNPLRILDCKVPACREIYAHAPKPLDYLAADDREHHDRVLAGLDALGVDYIQAPGLVRGLDYYTRTVFELQSDRLGAQDTVSAGGRYDRLVEQFGGPPTPAVGFAAGVERLLLAAGEDVDGGDAAPRIAWIALDDEARQEGLVWVERLRAAGLAAQHFVHKGSLKAQMRAANGAGASHALLQGGDERAAGEATVKDLASGEQARVALELEALMRHLGVRGERG